MNLSSLQASKSTFIVYKLDEAYENHDQMARMLNFQKGIFPLNCLDVLIKPTKLH